MMGDSIARLRGVDRVLIVIHCSMNLVVRKGVRVLAGSHRMYNLWCSSTASIQQFFVVFFGISVIATVLLCLVLCSSSFLFAVLGKA